MTMHDEVNKARKKLFEALGSNSTKYLSLLRLWFQMKIRRDEFESASRQLLSSDQVHLHNMFIVSLLSKCHRLSPRPPSISESPSRGRGGKGRRRSRAERTGFDPVDAFDYMTPPQPLPSHAQHEAVRLMAQEKFLPDAQFMYSRAMLGAWEHGLEGAEEGAIKLLISGLMTVLRNVIFATICRRRSFHLLDNRSPYGVNKPYVNRWYRRKHEKPPKLNIVKGVKDEKTPSGSHIGVPTQEEMEQKYVYDLSCSSEPSRPDGPITLYDLLDTVKVHRNLIPSASVMSLFQERIVNRLNHRSHEEMRAIQVLDRSLFSSLDNQLLT